MGEVFFFFLDFGFGVSLGSGVGDDFLCFGVSLGSGVGDAFLCLGVSLSLGSGVGEAFLCLGDELGEGVGLSFGAVCFRFRAGVGVGETKNFWIFSPNDSAAWLVCSPAQAKTNSSKTRIALFKPTRNQS